MKISITISLLLLTAVLAKEPVQVTLYASAEPGDDHDYVQISATVSQLDASLPKALSGAANIVQAVVDHVTTFCGDKKKCEDAIEVSPAEIKSEYKLMRRVETFMHFVVTHEITIKVFKPDQIGVLVDNLQRLGIRKFESFQWKGNQDTDEEASIVEGATQRADALCSAFGHKVNRVVSIELHEPEEEEEKAGEEEEAEEEQEEEQDRIFKLVFECTEKKAAAGKTKDEQL